MCRMRQSLLRIPICFLLLPLSWGQGRQEATKPHLNIGTIGHAGHGKTTLTAAITRVLHQRFPKVQQRSFESINNPPQQERRGIAIAAAQLEYETANRHYAHIDCSSQADCIKAIITGAVQMDGAILVVSAVDGPMPQTDQQVALARQSGIAALVVFLNKADLVDEPGQLEGVEKAVRELLSRHGFPGHETPVISGSALKALQGDQDAQDSILRLLDAIDSHLPSPRRAVDKPFLMPIQDISSIAGRGTLLKGRIEGGRIQVGQEVEIVGIRPTTKWVVAGLERFRKLLDQGQAGDEMGLLVRGLGRNVERGQVVAAPGSVTPHTRFLAAAYFLTQQEGGRHTPFFSGYRPQFYIRSADVTGTVQLPQGMEMVMPGDQVEFTATLVAPIPMEKGLRFAIREGGRTVGAGRVSQILD